MATNPDPLVPVSTFISALAGVLSDEDQAALATTLSIPMPQGVRPGDLITADMFNMMLQDLNSLKQRLAALEGIAGAPVIERIEPQFVDKALGSRITIFGRNLEADVAGTTVFFDNVQATAFFSESNDSLIAVPIPLGISNLPRTVQVRVGTRSGNSNSLGIRVVEPVVEPAGTITVRNQGAPLGEIEVGESFTLNWRIVSQLNVERRLEFEPIIENAVGASASAWQNAIDVVDAIDRPFEPGESRDVAMKFTVPANAESVRLGLLVSTADGAFSRNSDLTPLVVGEEPEISDPRAAVVMRAFFSSDQLGRAVVDVGGTPNIAFSVAPNQSLVLPFDLSTATGGGGRFQIESRIEGQTSRWQTRPVGGNPNFSFTVGSNTTVPVDVPITSSSVSDTSTVSFIIVTARHFSGTSTTSDFSSFARIPIVGK